VTDPDRYRCQTCGTPYVVPERCGDDATHDGRSLSDGKYHLFQIHTDLVTVKDGVVVEVRGA